MTATMTIGEAATSTGVSPKALRLWESKGLLPPADRTDAGYRLFSPHDIEILRFIRRAKALDLTLAEIKEILDLQRTGEVTCDRVTELLDVHLTRIDQAIAELSELRQTLHRARSRAEGERCRGEETTVCRIIDTLAPE